MQKPITGKEIFRQLKADLIGKDSYRGVTLTYSWLANQFGHFSLGFIPTLIAFSILKKYTTIPRAALFAAIIISVLWLLFELYNFLGPLLSKRHSESKLLYIPSRKTYTFPPAWSNVAFDTFTDLCFFWLGAFSASLFLSLSCTTGFILIAVLVIVAFPSYYWYLTKMYLQQAVYPYQYRLSQWDFTITDEGKKTVLDFLKKKETGMHFFIFGGRKSGKTSLSVGIATELSIKHQTCLYTTGMKLYHMFSENDRKIMIDNNALWTWRTTSLLVIDDVNPGNPIKRNLITPRLFLELLDLGSPRHDENRNVLRQKNVVWVMGNEDRDLKEMSWKQMLLEIGVTPEKIVSVNLESSE